MAAPFIVPSAVTSPSSDVQTAREPGPSPDATGDVRAGFAELGLEPRLLRAVRELGFARPTPIQREAIPPALAGRDLLACAVTGSGKTAAFGLPILQRLAVRPRRATRALVLAPTRELAAQIQAHLRELARHTPVGSAAVFGGVGMEPQERAFRSGVGVVVATPGRLLDHFQRGYAALRELEVLVLDEADRMLDMGFLPDVRRVLKHLPRQRQTLFFSATMPAEIAALAGEMLSDPVAVRIDRRPAPAARVTQSAYPVGQQLKPALLLSLLRRGDVKSALVFTRTKHRANRLADWLTRQGVRAARIHGNRSQSQRTLALEGFKAGHFQALVATDIAARGIDVTALGHVVNFDVPLASDDYIHRVGRTGRAEATGEAFTFVAPEEQGSLQAIERALRRALPRVVLPDFDYSQRPPVAAVAAAARAARPGPGRSSVAWGDRRPSGAGPRGSGRGPRPSGRARPGTAGPGARRFRARGR